MKITQEKPPPEVLTVECPICGALPGKPCTSAWRVGVDIESTHNKRAIAAASRSNTTDAPKAPQEQQK